jgi:DnaJ-class molecular chaperone
MTEKEANSQNRNPKMLGTNYYEILGISSRASVTEIRKAYWELSKRYHPDTTQLPKAIATAKFQQLNEAYATLTNPQQRLIYDQKQRYYNNKKNSNISNSNNSIYRDNSAYLEPTDRPLSAGEIFALFVMGLTIIGCLLLAIAIGLTRPDVNFGPIKPPGITLLVVNC